MLKKAILLVLVMVAFVSGIFADQADLVFAAVKAKNDKEAARLLQSLALARDFKQLDKVQEKNPEFFEAKYFPEDFISNLIVNFPEEMAKATYKSLVASGTTNPFPKNDWQWYKWDLDIVLRKYSETKDPKIQKTLSDRWDTDLAELQMLQYDSSLEPLARMVIGFFVKAVEQGLLTMGYFTGPNPEETALRVLTGNSWTESKAVLEYLFKAGVPFLNKLPASLELDAWGRVRNAFETFTKITTPDKQSEYESKAEFTARNADWKRKNDLILSTELVVPAQLALGSYNSEEGFFNITIDIPAFKKKEGEDEIPIIQVLDLDKAVIRYYVNRKNAPFFKEKGFAAWAATAMIKARTPGIYGLRELQVKNGKDVVEDGLWAYAVRSKRGSEGEHIVYVDNYVGGRAFDFSGTKVSGDGAKLIIPADDVYVLTALQDSPIVLWQGELSIHGPYSIGDIGPAGGFIFYDKGSVSDGWRYLEAAPSDQSVGIRWDDSNNNSIDTGAKATEIGSGKANTAMIVAKRGAGDYAALLCDKLILGGFSDWFLPSKDELNLMNINLWKASRGGFENDSYWSSSTPHKESAWALYFDRWGNFSPEFKYRELNVRAIRAFDIGMRDPAPDTPVRTENLPTISIDIPAPRADPVQPDAAAILTTEKETSMVSPLIPEEKSIESTPQGKKQPVTEPLVSTPSIPAKVPGKPITQVEKPVASPSIALILVEGGTYVMRQRKDAYSKDTSVDVTLSTFYLGTYEVTQEEYGRIMGKNPSKFTGNPRLPVEQVSWYDAVAFCNELSKREGLNPAYLIKGSQVTWDQKANGYRLPTKSESEYASRGGKLGKGFEFSGSNDVKAVAWYKDNSAKTSHPVGTKAPNELGLFDLTGNVIEWNWDWMSDGFLFYPQPVKDPTGPVSSPLNSRIVRGESWKSAEGRLQVRYSSFKKPDVVSNEIGFRVARSAK